MMLADQVLSMAAQSSPLIDATLHKYRDLPIKELLDSIKTNDTPPFQAREDLWEVIESEIIPFFGKNVANEVISDLKVEPIIPTSNHYGIDTAADSIQGSLLFLLR